MGTLVPKRFKQGTCGLYATHVPRNVMSLRSRHVRLLKTLFLGTKNAVIGPILVYIPGSYLWIAVR